MTNDGLSQPQVAVIIASAGRPEILADAIRGLQDQREANFKGYVSVPDQASLPVEQHLLDGWEVVVGVRGAASQRNAALDLVTSGTQYVFIFDDDTSVRADYIANALKHFESDSRLVGLTGHVLADGKKSHEISLARARKILQESWQQQLKGRSRATKELYGANFAFRISACPKIRFDDRLPLYSWLEDHDLARRLAKYGELAEVDDCKIVHRAAGSGGRTKHLLLGYSQVMNPVYLQQKGSFPPWLAAYQLGRPVSKNIVGSILGPEREWRRTRLKGNSLAFLDLSRGRVTPERIVELARRGE